ncbi:MAG: flavodoxin [Anaerolineae bacterium]|nr:flavodoxin [Anaerolineae bacterium]
MARKVLAAYATRYGSTKETMEVVGERLRERGFEVSVRPAKEVTSIEGVDAVVLGVPLYIGRWLKDGQRFLSGHAEDLARLPVAVLSLGPLAPQEEAQGAREQFDKELAKYPQLRPVATGVFGGKFDPATLGFLDNLLTKLPASPLYQRPASDARDWDAIRAWAEALADRLTADD